MHAKPDLRVLLIVKIPNLELHGRYPLSMSVAYPKSKAELGFSGPRYAVKHFELTAEGKLVLRHYSFHPRRFENEQVDFQFAGNFTVELGYFPDGSKMLIPFENGKMVRDREQWVIETRLIAGIVRKEIRSGLIVDLWTRNAHVTSFLPRSLCPPEYRENLHEMVGSERNFETKLFDYARQTVVVSLEHEYVDAV